MANGYGTQTASVAGRPVAAKKRRALGKVSTFKDMTTAQQPTSVLASKRPRGRVPGVTAPSKRVSPEIKKRMLGGGAGVETAGVEAAGVEAAGVEAPIERPYAEAQVPSAAGAFGGFQPFGGGRVPAPPPSAFGEAPQAPFSPWYGAPGAPPPEPPPAEFAEDQPEEGGWDFGGLPDIDVMEDLSGFGIEEREELPGAEGIVPEEAAERFGGLPGTELERRGVVPPEGAETDAERETREQGDALDEKFETLIEEYDAGWDNTDDQLKAQLAMEMRRQAEINAQLGTSVAGGFSGAMAATALGGVQALANALADHKKGRTALQLQWLDKRVTFDERREAEERAWHRTLIQGMLESGQEIPEDLWAKAYGSEEAGRAATGTGGAAGEMDLPEGATGEAGQYRNERGDWLMGPGGLGTSGSAQGDPWEADSPSHQWYARTAGPGRYEYYREDEEGNEVSFRPGIDGGRWPGDVSLWGRSGSGVEFQSRRYESMTGYASPPWAEARYGGDFDETYIRTPENHPDSPFAVDLAYVNEQKARFSDKYGGDHWQAAGKHPQLIDAEITLFTSLFQAQNEGDFPDNEVLWDHLNKAGFIGGNASQSGNPFFQEEE